jgi:tetratricopeptide (TPR) repeat protein
LSILAFIAVRRVSQGLAAPTLVAVVLGLVYAWFVILRIPELSKPLEEAEAAAKVQAKATAAADVGEPAERDRECAVGAAATAEQEQQDEPAAHAVAAAAMASPSVPEQPNLVAAASPAVPEQPNACAEAEREEAVDDALNAPAGQSCVTEPAKPAEPTQPAELGETSSQPTQRARAHQPAESARWASELPTRRQSDDSEDSSQAEDETPSREQEDDKFADPERAQQLRLEGNELFKAGKTHDAREAYSEAIYLTPVADKKDIAVLHSNRAACYQKIHRWDEVVTDCTKAIECDPEYVKAFTRRSNAYEQQQKWHDAHEDLKKAIELDPTLKSKEYKREAVLQKRAAEQFEKDKDEMMGKLKELGNTVLGKFGMNMDSFKMEQDPNTGSYSVKYGS